MRRDLSPFSIEPEHLRQQFSTSTPRSRSPSSAELDFVFSHSEILKYDWFQMLVLLMFIFTGVIMTDFFTYSYDTDNLADVTVLFGDVWRYIVMLSYCWFVIFIFTSICLAIHFKKMRLPIALARWLDRYQQQHPERYSTYETIFGSVLTISLLGSVFGLSTLLYSTRSKV